MLLAKKKNLDKNIKKDDTLSDISQISEVDESQLKNFDKHDESRELFEQALGHLSVPKTHRDVSKLQIVTFFIFTFL